MKKLLALLLFTGTSTVSAAFYPAVVSTTAVQIQSSGGNLNSVGYQTGGGSIPVQVQNTINSAQSGTWTVQPGNTANTTAWKVDGSAVTQPVSGTFFPALQPVSLTQTSVVGATVTFNGTQNVQLQTGANAIGSITNTSFAATQSGVYQVETGTNTYPVAVKNVPAVSQSGTWTVQPGNTANTTAWKVDGSAVTQPISGTVTANQGAAGTSKWGVDATTGIYVNGGTADAATDAGNPIKIGGVTRTTTWPTATTSGQRVNQGMSNVGQILVTGVPQGIVSFTTKTVTTTEEVLLSSAGASTFTYLCGCIVTNTSATNTYITLRNTGPTQTSVNSLPIGAPANYIPTGIWPGCANPFYKSASNANITIQAANSVSSLLLTCQTYTGP